MPNNNPSPNLPLPEVMGAANGLVAAKLIEEWALGGALAAIYYVEPLRWNEIANDMKQEMRQKLAREPFEEKIRKVGQLVRLAKVFPRRAAKSSPAVHSPK